MDLSNFNLDDIMSIIDKLLTFFKMMMAWLGIGVLPEEGEYDYSGYNTLDSL